MASVRVVEDGTTLDLLVWRSFGRQDRRLVETTLALNPGLAALGTVLPLGTIVRLPEAPGRVSGRSGSIRLWS